MNDQLLWCPNCDIAGKVQILPQRDLYSGVRSCKATCKACGYSIDQLGSDGTLAKAEDEWRAICEHALEVKKQLLGATKMTEKQLELDINAAIGVTDWFDGAKRLPILSGWYNVRYKMSDREREERKPTPQRRWWNAGAQRFSWPIAIGEESTSDEILRLITHTEATKSNDYFEWQGLVRQHPETEEAYKKLWESWKA